MSASALTTAGAARSEAKPTRKPRRGRMRLLIYALLQLHTHRRAGTYCCLIAGHIVVTTVAGQGWLAGPKPSLDAMRHLTNRGSLIKGSELVEVASAIAGETRQKWRISPRVGNSNDVGAANGRAPWRLLLGVGCRYPRQTDAFSLSSHNSRATFGVHLRCVRLAAGCPRPPPASHRGPRRNCIQTPRPRRRGRTQCWLQATVRTLCIR
jgi:hypothetical protein